MVYIKAVNLRSSIQFITEKFGKDGLDVVANTLSEEDKSIINDPNLLVSRWIPLDLWVRFFEAIIRELNHGDESIMFEAAKYNANKELNSIYKVFIKMASPEFIVKSSGIIAKTYLKSDDKKIEVKPTQIDKNKFNVSLRGLEVGHRLFELGIVGWVKTALELSGAKNVKIDHKKSPSKNEDCFSTQVTWE